MRNTVLFTCGWPSSRHSVSASVAPVASAAAAVAASAAAASAALVKRWTRTARSASLGQKCASRERREGGMGEPQSGDVYALSETTNALFFTASPLLSSLLLSFPPPERQWRPGDAPRPPLTLLVIASHRASKSLSAAADRAADRAHARLGTARCERCSRMKFVHPVCRCAAVSARGTSVDDEDCRLVSH